MLPAGQGGGPEAPAAKVGATAVLSEEAGAEGIVIPGAGSGLFVGVRHFYDDEGNISRDISEVTYAVDDAVDLAHMFAFELGLLSPKNVTLSLSGDPHKPESIERLKALKAAGAKRIAARYTLLLRRLPKVANSASERGLLVVGIAAHGFSKGGDWVLCQDTVLGSLTETSLRLDRIRDTVAASPARRRLLLIDACRERISDSSRGMGIVHEGMAQSFNNVLSDAEGMVVMNATIPGGFSFDDHNTKNGVFSSFIMKGLRGAAEADDRGFITPETLALYVNKEMKRWVTVNRPEFKEKSKGIGYNLEDPDSRTMPLAINPRARKSVQAYTKRRDAALAKLKQNVGGNITGSLFDDICKALTPDIPSTERLGLINELEMLDGSKRSRRIVAEYFRPRRDGLLKKEKSQHVAASTPARPIQTASAAPPRPAPPTGDASEHQRYFKLLARDGLSEALTHFQLAVEKNAEDADARAGLAIALALTGKETDASYHVRRLKESRTQTPVIRVAVGLLEGLAKRYQDGMYELRRALEEGGDRALVQLCIAAVAERNEDLERAQEAFKDYEALVPTQEQGTFAKQLRTHVVLLDRLVGTYYVTRGGSNRQFYFGIAFAKSGESLDAELTPNSDTRHISLKEVRLERRKLTFRLRYMQRYDWEYTADLEGNFDKIPAMMKVTTTNGRAYGRPSQEFLIRQSALLAGNPPRLYSYAGEPQCFVATAAYGCPMEGRVITLRCFRDRYLLSNAVGRAFVHLYYRHSPPAAAFIAKRTWARWTARVGLLPLTVAAGAALGQPSDVALLTLVIACAVAALLLRRHRMRARLRAGGVCRS